MSSLSKINDVLFKVAKISLVTIVWTSAAIFGLYILLFYAAAMAGGDMKQWNGVIPGLYDPENLASTFGIGIHFAAGGIILVLGAIQFIEKIREKYPKFHRVIGRIYILSCIVAAIGGLLFIFVKGTIGGWVMDLGFGLYGVLMFIAAIETFRNAVKRQLVRHRAWAIRLFALAIGSWLYRMEYGLWFLLADGMGHADQLRGPFDQFMVFFFYIPNLFIAELFIANKMLLKHPILKGFASLILFGATAFLVIATYYFTLHFWIPAIL